MLSWDVVVLNIYLLLNICGYLLYMKYLGKPSQWLYIPLYFVDFLGGEYSYGDRFLLAGLPSSVLNSAILGVLSPRLRGRTGVIV